MKGRENKRERETQSAETSRVVSCLALLHNFIALSPVFATQRKKAGVEGKDGCFIIPAARDSCEHDCRNAICVSIVILAGN